MGIGLVGAKWQNNHLNKSSLWHIWRSVPCSAQRSQQIFFEATNTLLPLHRCWGLWHKKGFFYTTMREHAVATSLSTHPSSFGCCSATLLSSLLSEVRWIGHGWEFQSDVHHFGNVLGASEQPLSVDLVPWLGMAVATWELKHSAGSVADSEEVHIPKLLHVLRRCGLLSLNSENKEKKVGSCVLWCSRHGKPLCVNIPISTITYCLSDVAVIS